MTIYKCGCGKELKSRQAFSYHKKKCSEAKNFKIVKNLNNESNYDAKSDSDYSSINTELLEKEMFCEELSVENNNLTEENTELKNENNKLKNEIMELKIKNKQSIMELEMKHKMEIFEMKMEMKQQQFQQPVIQQHVIQQPVIEEPKIELEVEETDKVYHKNKHEDIVEYLNETRDCDNYNVFMMDLEIKEGHLAILDQEFDMERKRISFMNNFYADKIIRYISKFSNVEIPIVCVNLRKLQFYWFYNNEWTKIDNETHMEKVIKNIQTKASEILQPPNQKPIGCPLKKERPDFSDARFKPPPGDHGAYDEPLTNSAKNTMKLGHIFAEISYEKIWRMVGEKIEIDMD